MFRSVKELFGYSIRATDDIIGGVHDFLLDDHESTVRYLVVDTGTWLPARKVMIAPEALSQPDWPSMTFPVNLTKEQVRNSPDVDVGRPVSRTQEQVVRSYYDWPLYWAGFPAPAGTGAYMPTDGELQRIPQQVRQQQSATEVQELPQDTHLRSARELMGYHIQATDSEIGHVEDFILDDASWRVRYLVVDTRNWLPGRKVLVSPDWVEAVDWNERKVDVNMTKEQVEKSPEFDPSAPVNRQYEEVLYDYYGRPKYWP